jgi:hypothetical protein
MRLFYSWQSDIPSNTKILRKVLKKVCNDLDIEYTEDTRNETGAEHIIDILQRKISNSNIFAGDITITGRTEAGKPQINSNVAYELGFAEAKLTRSRLLLILNEAYGSYEDIPFDLGKRMVTTFDSSTNQVDSKLEKKLYDDLHRKISAMKTVTTNASESTLNTAEKSILYWGHRFGGDQVYLAHVDYSEDVLCPGSGYDYITGPEYAFHRWYDKRDKALYMRAINLLIEKGLLTPSGRSGDSLMIPRSSDNTWALTEEGEILAKTIEASEVNELSKVESKN